MSLYIFATEHGYSAFFVHNIKQALQNAILDMFAFGPSGVLPRVLPFTQIYPGFTQLPRLKLGKTVQRFLPITLITPSFIKIGRSRFFRKLYSNVTQ